MRPCSRTAHAAQPRNPTLSTNNCFELAWAKHATKPAPANKNASLEFICLPTICRLQRIYGMSHCPRHMWLITLSVGSVGALLTGSGPCGNAARFWNRYAPTSTFNGQFACQSNTTKGAIKELALLSGQTDLSCPSVKAVIRSFQVADSDLNACNATSDCPVLFECKVPPAECGYCAPNTQAPLRQPCFDGGTITCKKLVYNGIAAGIGVLVSGLHSLWPVSGFR